MAKWKAGRQYIRMFLYFVFRALCMFLCHLSGRQGHKADGDDEVDGEECLTGRELA